MFYPPPCARETFFFRGRGWRSFGRSGREIIKLRCLSEARPRARRPYRIACSLSDLSFWDFAQEQYLDVFRATAAHRLSDREKRVASKLRAGIRELHPAYIALHLAKFGERPTLPSPDCAASDGAALVLELEFADTKPPAK